MTTFSVIGKPTGKVDGPQKVSGAAKYTPDMMLPSTLWAKALRSPFPHAKIKSIDTSAASALPGVRLVLTGDDLGGMRSGRNIKDMPLIAHKKVRYIGEKVAVVAAETEEIAEAAVDLIKVEYEELAPVFDPIEAMKPDAPIIHEELDKYTALPQPITSPTNIVVRTKVAKGDIEKGFAEADRIFENTYSTTWMHQSHLEPHSCLVDASGLKIKVWASHKSPYSLRQEIARVANLKPQDIVIYPVTIGGDFGAKAYCPDAVLCYFVSKRAGRPVKMVSDYVEEFIAGNPRHPATIWIKTGVKNDGTIIAHQSRVIYNEGAYGAYKPGVMIGGWNITVGPYRVPNALFEGMMVYTNNVPGGFFRAPGSPQCVFAGESQINIIAREMGIDPIELRRKNLLHEGEPTATGEKYEKIKIWEVFEAVLEASEYRSKKGPFVGRGIALGEWHSAGGESNAIVAMNSNGSVTVKTSATEVGGGAFTIVQQVIAEELGCPVQAVSVIPLDTDAVNNDSGTGASRVTRTAGFSAQEAAIDLREKLRKIACETQGWPEEQATYSNGAIVNSATKESIPLKDIVRRSNSSVEGLGHFNNNERPHVVPYVAQVAEVEVDPETGRVKIRKFTTAHDAGKVLNPIGFEGQIDGGVMQGIGFALMEEIRIEDGRPLTTTFGDYKIPTMSDIPEIKRVILESGDGVGPYGSKSIGESPHVPVAAAIANAIDDAVGVRITTLPISAEKIYQALKEKELHRKS